MIDFRVRKVCRNVKSLRLSRVGSHSVSGPVIENGNCYIAVPEYQLTYAYDGRGM
jgi:hypothetical protein